MSKQIQIKFSEYYYGLVPRPTKHEWSALDQSIALNGLQEPITVNRDGVILDGYTRYEICQNRKIKPEYRIKEFKDKHEELLYVLETNATRRQLNAFQRVELFYEIFKIYSEQAKENQDWRKLNLNTKGGALRRYSTLVGVGEKRTHAALKIIESGNEELIHQCREGTLTVNAAHKILSEDKIEPNGYQRHIPSMRLLLNHFKDTPIEDQLKSILEMYQNRKK